MGERNTDLERFERLLDAYGGDPGAWPAFERGWAKALVERDSGAKALWDEARLLDTVLDKIETPGASADLFGAVMAAAPSTHSATGRVFAWIWPFGPSWQPAIAFTLAVLVGLAVGLQVDLGLGEEAIGAFDLAGVEAETINTMSVGE